MADLGDRIKGDPAVPARLGRGHDHPPYPLECQQPGELGHRDAPFGVLAAGHGDGVVVEQLVGDVHPGRHRRAHSKGPRVEEGAVADVLHVVRAAGEWGHARPLRAFAPHLGHAHLVASPGWVEPGHDVAADAEADQLVVGRTRRDVVGAPRAERCGSRRHGSSVQHEARPPVEGCDPECRAGWETRRREAARQYPGDGVAVDRTGGGHQRAALVVGLADDEGGMALAVEGLFDLGLDERRLVLDDEHFVEALSHGAHLGNVERPREAEPDEAQAHAATGVGVDAHVLERPEDHGVRVPCGNDADRGPWRADGDRVEPGHAGVLECAGESDAEKLLLGLEGAGSDHERPVRRTPGVRGGDAVSGRAEVDDCRAVGDVGDDLEPGPQARVTRQGHGVEAEAHDVGDGAWGEQWQVEALRHGG